MICFHGTPMTPVGHMARAFAGRHAMVSFEHPEQMEIAAEICSTVVLDNGAYSAWMAKRPHDFEGYASWCDKWLKHPAVEWCVIPDVIDGDEDANDELLSLWSLDGALSVPVYHMHESLDRLERLANAFPRIALGSSVQYAEIQTPAWWSRIAEMMEVVCDENGFPLCKLHGLRMLDPVIFAHLPLASADSCNVAVNVGIDGRWGGPYAPRSKWVRALVLMDRVETHASAARWNGTSTGVQQNMELAG
jgi:hypothetical protein